jgi:signal recognition particle receptor subunit beta
MALFNYATKEITLKIVYYGPGLSGKTTNLQYLHSILNPETKGRLLSLSTEADRTLFFDFLPVELGKIRDFSIRFQLYTVPGQVRYNATRKIVLKGADAVIFVADSQREMREQNAESFENMRENLSANNINPDDIPIILQYNKRDLGNVASVEELNADLNHNNYSVIEACAIQGSGVEESFKLITKLLLKFIAKKHQIEIQPAKEEKVVEEVAAVPSEAPQLAAISVSSDMQTSIPAEEVPIAGDGDILDESPLSLPEELPDRDRWAVPEPEDVPPLQSEEIPVFPTEEELTPISPLDKEKAPVFPIDKIDRIIDEIAGLQGILTDIKNSMYVLSKEMKDIKDIKREQDQMSRALKDFLVRSEETKTKKSWFRF